MCMCIMYIHKLHIYTHTDKHVIYFYIYIYVYVYAYVYFDVYVCIRFVKFVEVSLKSLNVGVV